MSTVLEERPSIINTQDIVTYLIKFNGKLNVTAEKLHMTEEQLIAALASDRNIADSVTEQIRLRILLKSYEQFGMVNDLLQTRIIEAEASDVLKLYTTLSKNIAEMVGKQENTLESILKTLPANVRESIIRLMAG